jgi:hypothetical protein
MSRCYLKLYYVHPRPSPWVLPRPSTAPKLQTSFLIFFNSPQSRQASVVFRLISVRASILSRLSFIADIHSWLASVLAWLVFIERREYLESNLPSRYWSLSWLGCILHSHQASITCSITHFITCSISGA